MVSLRRPTQKQCLNLRSSHQPPSTRHRLPSRSPRESFLRHPVEALEGRRIARLTNLLRASTAMQATTFTLFPELPLELRERIWSMAPEPRLVVIAPELDHHSSIWQIRLRAKLVQTLFVCKESRNQTLRDYDLVKGDNATGVRTLVNWSRDTIFFDFPSEDFSRLGTVLRFFTHELCMAQSLALRLQWYFRSDLLGILSQFGQLQSLLFIGEGVRLRQQCSNARLIIKGIGTLYPDARGSVWMHHTRWMCDDLDRLPLLRHVSMSVVALEQSYAVRLKRRNFPLESQNGS